jgi:hypothetical protein
MQGRRIVSVRITRISERVRPDVAPSGTGLATADAPTVAERRE